MAWVQERLLSSGATSYEVVWREPSGRIRSKTFRRSPDAKRFPREVERSKDLGTYLDPNLGKVTLSAFLQAPHGHVEPQPEDPRVVRVAVEDPRRAAPSRGLDWNAQVRKDSQARFLVGGSSTTRARCRPRTTP
jgi:hypothetical protein